MRITYLNVSAQLGGAETSLVELLASIATAQPTWHLAVVLAAQGPLVAKIESLGIPTHVLPFPVELSSFGDSDLKALPGKNSSKAAKLLKTLQAIYKTQIYLRQLAIYLRGLQPDLIHSTGFKMHLLSVWARPSNVPVIWHMHDYVSSRPIMRRLLKWNSAKCDFIIANSENVRQDVLAACAPRAEVATIYNAIDFEKFSPHGPTIDLDAAAGLPLAAIGTVRIGLLATFAKWKGHSLFLKAVSLLPSTTPVRAYVIGAPIYQTSGSQHSLADLRAEVHRLGLTDRVGFTGFLYPPDSALRSLDVVVHASTQPEPFGMVIVEAMACGKPVIAVNSSGASEILSDAEAALFYECGNAQELSNQILTLVTSAALREQIGGSGRCSTARVLQGSRLAKEVAALYDRVARQAQQKEPLSAKFLTN